MPTLTYDLQFIAPAAEWKYARAWIESNAVDGFKDAAGKLTMGGTEAPVNASGSGSVGLAATVGDVMYRFIAEYTVPGRTSGPSGKGRFDSGWFPLTADADLADVTTIEVAPIPEAAVVAQLLTARDEAEADRVAAEEARVGAESARAGAEAVGTTNDAVIAGRINTPGSLANVALTTSFAPLAGNIDTTVRKMADDFADVNILVLGDSTAAWAGQFPDLLMTQVQTLYPHRTLEKATWDNVAHAWGAFAQVGPSGTGTRKIKFWQGAVSGTVCEQPLNYFGAWVGSVQPDLVLVHYGHNYGATAAGGGFPSDAAMDSQTRERFMRFVAEVKRACPDADVLLTSQNPYLTAGARPSISNIRADAWRRIAADLGCAYGPILEAYLATGNPAAYLGADLLHPTSSGATNGAALAAATLLPMFKVRANHEVTQRGRSPFLARATNLLVNGDFADFASPPTLGGWTAFNVTLAKDATNYESINGYSVKGTGTAAANNSIYQSLPMRRVKGQVITLAARFWVASTQASGSVGRVQITGDGGLPVQSSGTITSVRDNWVWVWATARIPDAATFATASILFGAAVGHECSVDRAVCHVGSVPMLG